MAYLGREAAKAPLVTADIPDDSITAAKIVDATIAAGDLAANSVDSSELVDGSIDTSHIADDQVTLAKMAHGADGSLITYSASTVPELVAPGTTGHVLTSRGDASTPTFQAAAGGVTGITTSADATAITIGSDESVTFSGDLVPSTPLSHRNIVINGAMQVSQRGTSEASLSGATSGYKNGPDRLKFLVRNCGTFTISQSTEAPDGFAYSYKIDCTIADAILDANSYLALNYDIEGQDLRHLKKGTASAEKFTVSFYVRSSKTGTYIFEVQDEDNDRHIAQTYTISSADTWERKELTFVGDTSDPLTNDNNLSMSLTWRMALGTNYTSGTLATSWADKVSANLGAGIGVNLGDNTANDWHITGIQLELGSNATPFEHRSYADELARCQRYFYQFINGADQFIGMGSYLWAGQLEIPVSFPTTMRTNPTLAFVTVTDKYIARNEDEGIDAFSAWTGLSGAGNNTVMIYTNSDVGGTVGQSVRTYTDDASCSISFLAEL